MACNGFVGGGGCGGAMDQTGRKQADGAVKQTNIKDSFHGRALPKDLGPPRKYRDGAVSHSQLRASTKNRGEFGSRDGVQRL